MNLKLIKCINILLIIILLTGIFIATFLTNKAEAKEQNTEVYKKGSDILDDYQAILIY